MDEKDRELLERQMRRCQPPSPGYGQAALFGSMLFLSGLVLGSLLFAPIERSEQGTPYAMRSTLEQTR